MSLKYKLKTLDGLSEAEKALYAEKDGEFYLVIEGLPEPKDDTGMKKKLDELLAEKKAEQAAKLQAEEVARKEAEEKAKLKGDHEALANSYKERIAQLEQEKAQQAELAAKQSIESKAMEIAASLAEGSNQKILSRFISERLRVENGEIKVTDANGNLTISTIDDLSKEFRSNQDFASLITASKASGGGGAQGGAGSGGAVKRSEMTNAQKADYIKEHGDKAFLDLQK